MIYRNALLEPSLPERAALARFYACRGPISTPSTPTNLSPGIQSSACPCTPRSGTALLLASRLTKIKAHTIFRTENTFSLSSVHKLFLAAATATTTAARTAEEDRGGGDEGVAIWLRREETQGAGVMENMANWRCNIAAGDQEKAGVYGFRNVEWVDGLMTPPRTPPLGPAPMPAPATPPQPQPHSQTQQSLGGGPGDLGNNGI